MRPDSAPARRQRAQAGCARAPEFLGQTPDLKMGKLRPGESLFVLVFFFFFFFKFSRGDSDLDFSFLSKRYGDGTVTSELGG